MCLTVIAMVSLFAASACTGGRPSPSAAPTDRCSSHAIPAPDTSTTARFERVLLHVPKGWYYVRVCFSTGALEYPLGYLTTQQPIAQCRPNPHSPSHHIGCGAPVEMLRDDNVLVVINSTFPPPDFSPNSTIAGRPAHLERAASPGGMAGATNTIKATIKLKGGNFIEIYAYIRARNPGQRDTVLRMLRTATYIT